LITLDQENTIRNLLAEENPRSDRQIAREVGVSRWLVSDIRRAHSDVVSLDRKTREQIRAFLLAGLPPGAVEVKTKIPREMILKVRRFYSLLPRRVGEHKSPKCPTCGSIMFSDKEQPDELQQREWGPVPASVPTELVYVARDICDLNEMRIIPNPLFYHLACRAEEALRRIDNNQEAK